MAKREHLNVLARKLQDVDSGAHRASTTKDLLHVKVKRDAGALFSGADIVQWMMDNIPGIECDADAMKLGQMLLDSGELFHTEGSRVFMSANTLFYHIRSSTQTTMEQLGAEDVQALLDDEDMTFSEPDKTSSSQGSSTVPHTARFDTGDSVEQATYGAKVLEKKGKSKEARKGSDLTDSTVDEASLKPRPDEENLDSPDPDISLMQMWPTLNQMKMTNSYPHPLHMAAAVGKSPGVLREMIMMFGVDKRDNNGRTPLMFAALGNNKSSTCTTLLKCSARVDFQDEDGITALHVACYNGNRSAISVLLSYKASIAMEDNAKHTALHWSMVPSDPQTLKSLSHYLAQFDLLNQADHNGLTALHWAIFFNRPEHLKLLLKMKTMAQIDLTGLDLNGRTLATYAVEKQASLCLKILLKAEPVLLTYPDKQGSAPLHHASVQPNLDCFHTLLNHKPPKDRMNQKVELNALNHYKRSPLHCAVAYGKLESAKELMKLGAEIDLVDCNGKTPVDYARELDKDQGRSAMLRILLGDSYVSSEELVSSVMQVISAESFADEKKPLQRGSLVRAGEKLISAFKKKTLRTSTVSVITDKDSVDKDGQESVLILTETHVTGKEESEPELLNKEKIKNFLEETRLKVVPSLSYAGSSSIAEDELGLASSSANGIGLISSSYSKTKKMFPYPKHTGVGTWFTSTSFAEDKTRAAEDKTIVSEDKTIASEDKTETAEDKTIAAEGKTVTAEDKTIASEDRTVTAGDKTIASEDKMIAAVESKGSVTADDQEDTTLRSGVPNDSASTAITEDKPAIAERNVSQNLATDGIEDQVETPRIDPAVKGENDEQTSGKELQRDSVCSTTGSVDQKEAFADEKSDSVPSVEKRSDISLTADSTAKSSSKASAIKVSQTSLNVSATSVGQKVSKPSIVSVHSKKKLRASGSASQKSSEPSGLLNSQTGSQESTVSTEHQEGTRHTFATRKTLEAEEKHEKLSSQFEDKLEAKDVAHVPNTEIKKPEPIIESANLNEIQLAADGVAATTKAAENVSQPLKLKDSKVVPVKSVSGETVTVYSCFCTLL